MKISTFLLPVMAFGISNLTLQAALIVSNSFENIGTTAPGDDWAYSITPTVASPASGAETTFDDSASNGAAWGPTDDLSGYDHNTPQEGSRFFGASGANNNGIFGDTVRGWVLFENTDLSDYNDVNLSFYWSGDGNIPEVGYFLAGTTDGSTAGIQTPQTDDGQAASTSGLLGTTSLIESTTFATPGGGTFTQGWTEVSLDIDDSFTNVAFALYGVTDSTSREFGWDNVQLSGTVIPEPGSLWLLAGGILAIGFVSRYRCTRC